MRIKNQDGQARQPVVPAEMKECSKYMGNNADNAMAVAKKLIGGLGEKDGAKWYGENGANSK